MCDCFVLSRRSPHCAILPGRVLCVCVQGYTSVCVFRKAMRVARKPALDQVQTAWYLSPGPHYLAAARASCTLIWGRCSLRQLSPHSKAPSYEECGDQRPPGLKQPRRPGLSELS